MQRRVLIIDDEQETCDLIERVVGYLGMEALTLKSTAQAVDLLERNKFDLSRRRGTCAARETDANEPDDARDSDERRSAAERSGYRLRSGRQFYSLQTVGQGTLAEDIASDARHD